MDLERLFTVANNFALVGWALLAFAPRWRVTRKVVLSGAFSLVLAAAYTALLAKYFGSFGGSIGSLADVARMFSQPPVALVAWVHYLAFDLFIGAWEVRDAQRVGVPHLLVLPCLALTLLFGPVGLLLYYALRLLAAPRARTLQTG